MAQGNAASSEQLGGERANLKETADRLNQLLNYFHTGMLAYSLCGVRTFTSLIIPQQTEKSCRQDLSTGKISLICKARQPLCFSSDQLTPQQPRHLSLTTPVRSLGRWVHRATASVAFRTGTQYFVARCADLFAYTLRPVPPPRKKLTNIITILQRPRKFSE